jgi:hypothetical protein
MLGSSSGHQLLFLAAPLIFLRPLPWWHRQRRLSPLAISLSITFWKNCLNIKNGIKFRTFRWKRLVIFGLRATFPSWQEIPVSTVRQLGFFLQGINPWSSRPNPPTSSSSARVGIVNPFRPRASTFLLLLVLRIPGLYFSISRFCEYCLTDLLSRVLWGYSSTLNDGQSRLHIALHSNLCLRNRWKTSWIFTSPHGPDRLWGPHKYRGGVHLILLSYLEGPDLRVPRAATRTEVGLRLTAKHWKITSKQADSSFYHLEP